MVPDSVLAAQLDQTLEGTSFEGLGERYEGKVRDNYSRGDRRFIVVTDRISAFDRILGTIPFKGQVLNRLASWWFDRTSSPSFRVTRASDRLLSSSRSSD